jgi:hypothetical protein
MPSEFAQPSDFALRYDALMGRWSKAMASQFVRWLAPPPDQRWLDVGWGDDIRYVIPTDFVRCSSMLA